MHYSDLNLPVPYHETFDVLDSSKLQTFQDCPRKFFYQYILGWRDSEVNNHLAFGTAWHEAMEIFMRAINTVGYTDEIVMLAYDSFLRSYETAYPTGNPSETWGKDPGNAHDALKEYAKTYSRDNFETLYVEVAGTAPISQDRLIHFKLDSIIRNEDGYWSMEHKTTGRKTNSWMDKWGIMLQVGTYAHVLYTLYGDDAVGVMINGAILRKPTVKTGKANNEFMRVPVRKSRQMMAAWLWEVNHWIQQLDWNMQMLSEASAADDIMTCFPRNATSCSKFGCSYPGLCGMVPNPLKMAHAPPPGYEIEFWDPRKREETAKNVVHLEKGDGL